MKALTISLVSGPICDPLYGRIGEFEEREQMSVEVDVAPTHPDLNERIEEEFSSGSASYDLISTHTKYAPARDAASLGLLREDLLGPVLLLRFAVVEELDKHVGVEVGSPQLRPYRPSLSS
jgi:hypothetical protein